VRKRKNLDPKESFNSESGMKNLTLRAVFAKEKKKLEGVRTSDIIGTQKVQSFCVTEGGKSSYMVS